VGAKDRLPIAPGARDRVLLHETWPQGTAPDTIGEPGWEVSAEGIPLRRLHILNETLTPRPSGVTHRLDHESHYWEAMLRFPNAPVYATHKAREFPYTLGKHVAWPNLHTMRVLGRGPGPTERIRHVYLLHNGLNETRDLLFHYRLAAWILNGRTDAVCVIRPLPGHLTRYPFHGGFSETPLDVYLRDPMELFRQFLRHMIETQWLLSIIVPRNRYAVVTGGRLLSGAEQDEQEIDEEDRIDDENEVNDDDEHGRLAKKMAREWKAFFKSSSAQADKARREQYSRMPVKTKDMREVIRDLRGLLQWEAADPSQAPKSLPEANPESGAAEYPYVHMVGYSMGGFMAQAGFFGWPQVVASCTNVFAGGAIRDLAPTAFAHPEEWQAVLHALRYEFDGALAEGLLTEREGARVAGLDAKDFGYMKRIFYEVFLQYYKGGYSSRVAEFSRRLLFVVGGDDPIVRTENVLDAGPPEGITLLQLADVTHFPGGATWKPDDQQQVEREQRTFWLPEIGRVIAHFSERAAVALHNTLAKCWDGGGPGVVEQLVERPDKRKPPKERGCPVRRRSLRWRWGVMVTR
jgi:pimeloyl-ACP methyl ester carboxylesterase